MCAVGWRLSDVQGQDFGRHLELTPADSKHHSHTRNLTDFQADYITVVEDRPI